MNTYTKYILPVVVAVAIVGGYNWLSSPETMNQELAAADLDINAIEPAMGPDGMEVGTPVSDTSVIDMDMGDAESVVDEAADMAEEGMDTVEEHTEEMMDDASDMAEDAADVAEDAMDSAEDAAEDMGDHMGH